MPPYQGTANSLTTNPVIPQSLASPGDVAWVWGTLPVQNSTFDASVNAVTSENTPANGTASQPVYVGPSPGPTGVAPLVDVEIIFDQNPGAINLQVQCAEGDSDAEYLTPSNPQFTITAVVNKGTKYIATASFLPLNAPFARLLQSSVANAGTTWRVRFIRR